MFFFSQKQTNKTKKKSYFVILLATKVVSLLLVQFCRCMTLAACRTYIYLVFSFLLLFHCLQHDNLLNVINRYNGYYSWIGNKWHKKKRQEKSGKVLFRECSKHAIWADRSLKNTIFYTYISKRKLSGGLLITMEVCNHMSPWHNTIHPLWGKGGGGVWRVRQTWTDIQTDGRTNREANKKKDRETIWQTEKNRIVTDK